MRKPRTVPASTAELMKYGLVDGCVTNFLLGLLESHLATGQLLPSCLHTPQVSLSKHFSLVTIEALHSSHTGTSSLGADANSLMYDLSGFSQPSVQYRIGLSFQTIWNASP